MEGRREQLSMSSQPRVSPPSGQRRVEATLPPGGWPFCAGCVADSGSHQAMAPSPVPDSYCTMQPGSPEWATEVWRPAPAPPPRQRIERRVRRRGVGLARSTHRPRGSQRPSASCRSSSRVNRLECHPRTAHHLGDGFLCPTPHQHTAIAGVRWELLLQHPAQPARPVAIRGAQAPSLGSARIQPAPRHSVPPRPGQLVTPHPPTQPQHRAVFPCLAFRLLPSPAAATPPPPRRRHGGEPPTDPPPCLGSSVRRVSAPPMIPPTTSLRCGIRQFT